MQVVQICYFLSVLASAGTLAVTPEQSAAAPLQPAGKAPKKFIATLVTSNDEFVESACVLSQSLLMHGELKPAPAMVAFVTPACNWTSRELLGLAGWDVQPVDEIAAPTTNRSLCGRYCQTYTKLRIWDEERFEQGLFMDADTMVLPDHGGSSTPSDRGLLPLINFPDLNVMNPHPTWEIAATSLIAPHRFKDRVINSGVFIFKPSKETAVDMLSKIGQIEEASYQFEPPKPYEFGDQSFIQSYFQPCLLSNKTCEKYPIAKLDWEVWNVQLANMGFNFPVQNAKVIHFDGETKPWTCIDDKCDARQNILRNYQDTGFPDPFEQWQAIREQWWQRRDAVAEFKNAMVEPRNGLISFKMLNRFLKAQEVCDKLGAFEDLVSLGRKEIAAKTAEEWSKREKQSREDLTRRRLLKEAADSLKPELDASVSM